MWSPFAVALCGRPLRSPFAVTLCRHPLRSPFAVSLCGRPLRSPFAVAHCPSLSPVNIACHHRPPVAIPCRHPPLPSPIAVARLHCPLLPPPSKQPLSLSLVPVITAIAADVAADVALLLLPPYPSLTLLRPQQRGRRCHYHPCCRSFYSHCHSLPSLPLFR